MILFSIHFSDKPTKKKYKLSTEGNRELPVLRGEIEKLGEIGETIMTIKRRTERKDNLFLS